AALAGAAPRDVAAHAIDAVAARALRRQRARLPALLLARAGGVAGVGAGAAVWIVGVGDRLARSRRAVAAGAAGRAHGSGGASARVGDPGGARGSGPAPRTARAAPALAKGAGVGIRAAGGDGGAAARTRALARLAGAAHV